MLVVSLHVIVKLLLLHFIFMWRYYRANSLLPPRGIWEVNFGCQTWWQHLYLLSHLIYSTLFFDTVSHWTQSPLARLAAQKEDRELPVLLPLRCHTPNVWFMLFWGSNWKHLHLARRSTTLAFRSPFIFVNGNSWREAPSSKARWLLKTSVTRGGRNVVGAEPN